jgi:hypothetical protein
MTMTMGIAARNDAPTNAIDPAAAIEDPIETPSEDTSIGLPEPAKNTNSPDTAGTMIPKIGTESHFMMTQPA